jgi:hypothetical protein
MKRAYRIFLRLYPRDYRARFATEMSAAFEDASQDRLQRGRAVYVRFAIAELFGLALGAGVEWIAKLTTDASQRGRSLPDRLLMRPPGVSWESHYAGEFVDIPEAVREAQQRTETLVQRMVHAISHHDFEGARRYSNQERQARESLLELREKHGLNN